MRIMIKGGVWKNTEDEILKAAVMKYGKNQWARVSSLLVRKSAKQCKARWYEWLDPSIKKTEWTREEDEKLLHLAKLMPTQWRTIAPIVGRTPAQCLERYEKLLDAACSKDENYDPSDDPRRLRPGEIDPNPESKPARPDPVDMDEDEKEMLSEARARLANTRGKKAKRKAREKALEEARRLAQLQKTRELKAAGIELKGKRRKKQGIDYNAEVAFEKKAPHGFHDVSKERETSKDLGKDFRPVTLEELEGKRRRDIEENLQKQDIKRQKLHARNDAPSAIARNLAMNEGSLLQGIPRGKLMLPAPQISEAELEAIAKIGSGSGVDADTLGGAGGEATRALLGSYGATPLATSTPQRTPRTPAMGFDPIMQQAENLARMSAMSTPLAGGENPSLHPTDFSGATPKMQVPATPNPLGTPCRTPVSQAAAAMDAAFLQRTARTIAGLPATPASVKSTPTHFSGAAPKMRDELGLNDIEALALHEKSFTARKAALHLSRSELLAGLNDLPKPQNDYQILVPEMPEDVSAVSGIEEDARDAETRHQELEATRNEVKLRKYSQVIQRKYPRPVSLHCFDQVDQKQDFMPSAKGYLVVASKMVDEEMLRILQYDALAHPIQDEKKGRKGTKFQPIIDSNVDLEDFDIADLLKARDLLRNEVQFLRNSMGHADISCAEFEEVWTAATSDVIYVVSSNIYSRGSSATTAERISSLQDRFDATRGEMSKEAGKAAKLEKKIAILTGGLQARQQKLIDRINELHQSYRIAHEELSCYSALKLSELWSAPHRLQILKTQLNSSIKRESMLQDKFKALSYQVNVIGSSLA